MKLNKILFVSVLLSFSQTLLAYNPVNQNVVKQTAPLELDEPMMNSRFTLAPFMMSSGNKEFGFAIDFVVNDNFMVGPQLSYHKYTAHMYDVSAYGIGLSTTYSLTENFDDGWFINSGLKLYSYKSKITNASESSSEVPNDVINASLMYGYKWFFKDGFNVRLSAGLQYNTDDTFQETNAFTNNGGDTDYSLSRAELRGGSGLTMDSNISVGLIF